MGNMSRGGDVPDTQAHRLRLSPRHEKQTLLYTVYSLLDGTVITQHNICPQRIQLVQGGSQLAVLINGKDRCKRGLR